MQCVCKNYVVMSVADNIYFMHLQPIRELETPNFVRMARLVANFLACGLLIEEVGLPWTVYF